jgi:hypothetical protein
MSTFCALTPFALLLAPLGALHAAEPPDAVRKFVERHCVECHDADSKKGDLDLDALKLDLGKRENFAAWVKVFDRVESGEMPPKGELRPAAEELKPALEGLKQSDTNGNGDLDVEEFRFHNSAALMHGRYCAFDENLNAFIGFQLAV